MKRNPIIVKEDMLAAEALSIMNNKNNSIMCIQTK